jgi:hypothetical protein
MFLKRPIFVIAISQQPNDILPSKLKSITDFTCSFEMLFHGSGKVDGIRGYFIKLYGKTHLEKRKSGITQPGNTKDYPRV